jgi:fluoroquinolone transport system permease protein
MVHPFLLLGIYPIRKQNSKTIKMGNLIKLSINDIKLIFRDPTLRAFFALPIVLYVLVLWALPYAMERFESLEQYLPLFMIIAVVENTQLATFIMSMVFVEEKEIGVNKVYGILPIDKASFSIARLVTPYLFTVILNVILFAVQPFFEVSWVQNIVLSLMIGLIVPAYILGVNVIVKNKLEGMMYVKVFNVLVLLPFAGFFLPGIWKNIFALIPTHWVFIAVDQMLEGEPYVLSVIIGTVMFLVIIGLQLRKFTRVHFR